MTGYALPVTNSLVRDKKVMGDRTITGGSSSFSFSAVLGLFGEEAALAGFLKNLTKITALAIIVSN